MADEIKMSWAFAPPSAWTFEIAPIRELISRYVPSEGTGWVDPMCGRSTIAEFRNDMNPERNAPFDFEASEFCEFIIPAITNGKLIDGFLFDPPYSYRQVSEHYKICGMKARAIDTSANFVARVKNAINPNLRIGAHAITCGWNTVGFGKERGWKKVEILVVEHGSSHNNTLVTVEQKVR